MIYLDNMATVLRAAGLRVMETPGWATRAYPKWGGYQQMPTHVMVHHTASQTTPANDLNYILNNPLSPIGNIYLDRTGMVWLVAAGTAVTNGKGSSAPWNGGVPDNAMNHYSIAIEAANNGVGEPWPRMQTDAYVRLCAALCDAYNIPVNHVRAHFEWAPGRKIDPAGPSPWATGTASWNMDKFRADVAVIGKNSVELEDNMKLLTPSKRILDTRTNSTMFKAGETRQIAVPTTDPGAWVNVCAVNGLGAGFVSVWGGGPKPDTAALNFNAGGATSNSVPVAVTNGTISVFTSRDVHLIIDLYATWAGA